MSGTDIKTANPAASWVRAVLLLTAVMALAGCANMSPTGQRALSGGAIGAAGGAVLGTVAAGNPAVGAAVGGAVGAGVGAALPQIENSLNGN
ncbi:MULTISPECIES: glycine zipper domain-containing protein [Acidithiobacillus]|uniref:Glycine zipper domain-containing protein n=6 Tax=Acidithiobacillaceae TaxID=225058 RepID=A0A5P9XS56_ACITH|nr:glycine zipper domain-containing protein [Acidithiobacillus thiooxidans]OCX83620.1 hypothetical protein A6P08_10065 [Acidithiobacillus thiooxidans]QFX96875.1 hypothetical protein GCD22_02717 [Acidithiobacillus thiooxidans ATCC 19377]